MTEAGPESTTSKVQKVGAKAFARRKQVLPSPPPPPPPSPATRSSVLKNARLEVGNVVGGVRREAISTVAAKKNTVLSIPSIPSMLKEPPESIIEASGNSGIAAAARTSLSPQNLALKIISEQIDTWGLLSNPDDRFTDEGTIS